MKDLRLLTVTKLSALANANVLGIKLMGTKSLRGER